MGFKDKIKQGINKVKEDFKEKKTNIKIAWKLVSPTIKAKHIKITIPHLKIQQEGEVIYEGKDFKAECVKYKQNVGIHFTCGELPVALKIAQKTGDLRHLGLRGKIKFYKDILCDYEITLSEEKIIFPPCGVNLLYYKDKLVEVELPFSNQGEYIKMVDGKLIALIKQ